MGPIKILIVDDCDDDRFLYRRALSDVSDISYTILECENGEQGLDIAAHGKLDCVLLDYSLPGRNGIEILKRLRLFAPFLPVILLTGQGNESVAVTAIREGAQSYITKATIESEDLRRAIRLSIEHAAMEKRIADQKIALETFARALAHDLKEPVRTIRSYLDILNNPNLPEAKQKEYRLFVRQAADKMDALIESVYALLRADINSSENRDALCDPVEALQIVENSLRVLIEEREAVITHKEMPLCPIALTQLSRVFQNLIGNAIQHSTKKPRIHLDAEILEQKIVIRIADNGDGIPPEHQNKLFQPFTKISAGEGHLGLGLSICKKTIEAYGGAIRFETTLREGTTFFIELPKPKVPDHLSPKDAQDQSPETQAAASTNELARILLVDDSAADMELAHYALIEEGGIQCDFKTTSNGREALNILSQAKELGRSFDLVLLDINMPGLDGFETLAQIRACPAISHILVYICTTSTYEEDRLKAKELGANDYIVKPLTATALTQAISKGNRLRLHSKEKGVSLFRNRL